MKPTLVSTIASLLLLAGGTFSLEPRAEGTTLNRAVSATGFNIRDQSGTTNLQAFVSSYGTPGGSDSWFDVPQDFTDPNLSHWNRNGWEIVAFHIPGTNTQRGWYIDCGGHTVNLTFYGFNQDIGLVRS